MKNIVFLLAVAALLISFGELSAACGGKERGEEVAMFQTTKTKPPVNRAAHVWFRKGDGWKCCLCGAISSTKADDMDGGEVLRYEPLTEEERMLCPVNLGHYPMASYGGK